VFFNIIDEKAMMFLSKRISSSSGDIRVVFDVMKTAFQGLLNKLSKTPDSEFTK